jgi:type I restriction enzyme S subunit
VRLAEKLKERSQYLITAAKVILESLLESKVTEEEIEAVKTYLDKGDKKSDYDLVSQLKDELNYLDANRRQASQTTASKWVRRCSALELDSRIDCHFYNPDAVVEIEKVKKWNPKPLSIYVCEKRSEPPIHTDHYSDSGISIVSPANFTDFKINLEGTNKLNPAYKELFAEFLMEEGNVIFSLVGDVGHACIVPHPAPLAITYRRTAQIKLKGINPYLVTLFLNCRAGDLQLKRMTTGVIQAQLRLEDSVEVLIPTWTTQVQNYIGEKVRLSLEMQEQVEYLTTAAKLLVEALIEGKLTEEELKTAQEALQKGDREPDKAILSRLTHKGYDIKGEPPLFPDLDILYETIDKLNVDEQGE